MMSPKSSPPLSPMTAWAKACPRPVLPRRFGGRDGVQPAAAGQGRSVGFGVRRTPSSSTTSALRARSTSIGRGPVAGPRGSAAVPRSRGHPRRPSGWYRRRGTRPRSAISRLNEVRRTQAAAGRGPTGRVPVARRAPHGWPRRRAPPSVTATCALAHMSAGPMYSWPVRTLRRPADQPDDAPRPCRSSCASGRRRARFHRTRSRCRPSPAPAIGRTPSRRRGRGGIRRTLPVEQSRGSLE